MTVGHDDPNARIRRSLPLRRVDGALDPLDQRRRRDRARIAVDLGAGGRGLLRPFDRRHRGADHPLRCRGRGLRLDRPDLRSVLGIPVRLALLGLQPAVLFRRAGVHAQHRRPGQLGATRPVLLANPQALFMGATVVAVSRWPGRLHYFGLGTGKWLSNVGAIFGGICLIVGCLDLVGAAGGGQAVYRAGHRPDPRQLCAAAERQRRHPVGHHGVRGRWHRGAGLPAQRRARGDEDHPDSPG